MNNVGHVNAVAQTGKEVDVLGRSRTDVQHPQALLLLEVFEHGGPPAGVAGDAGAGEQGTAGALRLGFSLEQTANHACLIDLSRWPSGGAAIRAARHDGPRGKPERNLIIVTLQRGRPAGWPVQPG